MDSVRVLAAVRQDRTERYQENLKLQDNFDVRVVPQIQDALATLADRERHTDVFIVDNGFDQVHELIGQLRQKYPRMLIILVDEEADFGLPGQADEISIRPFVQNDLVTRINRLMSDRRLETLRSDSLPAVRNIAKRLRSAAGKTGKQDAALESCIDAGFEYAAYYQIDENGSLTLQAQRGPNAIVAIAPKAATSDDLMGWVAQNGQSRVAAPEDTPNHPLVARGRLGAIACVPVALAGTKHGVIAACRDRPGSITQENVLLLELIGAQLATALAKD